MKNFLAKLNKNRNKTIILVAVLAFVLWLVPERVEASLLTLNPEEFFITLVGYIVGFFITIAGFLLNIVMKVIVGVAKYNSFIKEDAIIKSWVIIRDLCNMFFVLIILGIAFATILRIESYELKKTLPRVLIMAVLINFSMMFCGLIIDFAQIIMLTFINAIGGQGSWVNTLGVDQYLKFAEETAKKAQGATSAQKVKEISGSNAIVGMALGLIFTIIALVVVVVFLVILVMRIVMIWIYVVLSPLAFLLYAFPGGQKYSTKWWGEFINHVIVGPVMAFFLWMAMMSANTISKDNFYTDGSCDGSIAMLCPQTFLNFVIAIGMLLGGLKIATELGVAGGSMASGALSKIKSTGSAALRKPFTGARDLALSGINAGGYLQRGLGAIGGMGTLTTLGLNRLATRGYVGLGARKRAETEKAEKFVSSINDVRILRRLANQWQVTPSAAATRTAARKKAPSVVNAANSQEEFNNLTDKEISAIPVKEWYRIAQSGIDAAGNSEAQSYLENTNNRSKRGWYYAGGGGVLPGAVGAAIAPRAIPGNIDTAYSIAPEEAGEGGAKKEGQLGVGKFVSKDHQENLVAVDFSKMPKDLFDDAGASRTGAIEGAVISDPNKIKMAAQNMSNIIGEQIKKLGETPIELKTGDPKEVARKITARDTNVSNLKAAQTKFDNISAGKESIKNLNMINTGSVSWKDKDKKQRIIAHERIHATGAIDPNRPQDAERYVEDGTKTVMQGNLDKQRFNKETGEFENVRTGLKREELRKMGEAYTPTGAGAPTPTAPAEAESYQVPKDIDTEYGETGGGEPAKVDTTSLEKEIEKLSGKIGGLGAKFDATGAGLQSLVKATKAEATRQAVAQKKGLAATKGLSDQMKKTSQASEVKEDAGPEKGPGDERK